MAILGIWDMDFMDGDDICDFLPVTITPKAVYGTTEGQEHVLTTTHDWELALDEAMGMGLTIEDDDD